MQLEEDQTEIQSHLTIVGAVLESSDIYRSKRQELLRELVLRAIQELERTSLANSTKIYGLICYKNLNLIKKGHLNNILKSLEEEGVIGSIADKSGKSYYVQSIYQRKETPLIKSLRSSYRTFICESKQINFEDFLEIITSAFSSYGVTTFDNLFKKKNSSYLNLEGLIESKRQKITDVQFETFKEGVYDFFESESPDTVAVKVGLAQTYMAMKMMGAGNWKINEFQELLEKKQLLLDSNILFSFLSAEEQTGKNFIADSFQVMTRDYGVNFLIAAETVGEFTRAFHSQLIELEKAFQKSANISLYKDTGGLDLDWFDCFNHFKATEPDSTLDDFAQYISIKIQKFLESLEVQVVHLETGEAGDSSKARNYQSTISRILLDKKRLPKSEKALEHDSRVALYLEENKLITFFTYDSCWRHLKIDGDMRYLNCGDLLLYMTIGTANSKELSQLLSHIIKENILPFKSFFSLRDIESLRNFEEKVAALPRSRKRELSFRLKTLRREKIDKGTKISSEEITRTAFHYLCEINDSDHEKEKVSKLQVQLREKDATLSGLQAEKVNLSASNIQKDSELKRVKTFVYNLIAISVISVIFNLNFNVELTWTLIGPILLVVYFLLQEKLELKKAWSFVAGGVSVVVPVLTLVQGHYNKQSDTKAVVKVAIVKSDEVSVKASVPNRVDLKKKENFEKK